jgi:hypothetical protein
MERLPGQDLVVGLVEFKKNFNFPYSLIRPE